MTGVDWTLGGGAAIAAIFAAGWLLERRLERRQAARDREAWQRWRQRQLDRHTECETAGLLPYHEPLYMGHDPAGFAYPVFDLRDGHEVTDAMTIDQHRHYHRARRR